MTKTQTKYAAAALLAVVTGIYATPTLAQTLRANPPEAAWPSDIYNSGGSYYYGDSYEGPNRAEMEHLPGN